MGKIKRIEGRQIGTWLVVAEYEGDKSHPAKCLCKCAVCGKEKLYNRKTILHHSAVCEICHPKRKRSFNKSSSICIDCVNSCGNCSWSAKFQPVEGWTATPEKKLIGEKEYTAYHVTECPKFLARR